MSRSHSYHSFFQHLNQHALLFITSRLLPEQPVRSRIVSASKLLTTQERFPIQATRRLHHERTAGNGELDQIQVYGATFVSMLGLAYENSGNLTEPVSYAYPAITLNITGQDETTPYYRQFASYTLYHALQTMIADNDFTVSNFKLQNKAGTIACKVIIAPPSADWQRLIGGFSGGLSPRNPDHITLPVLEKRQSFRLGNESLALEKLTPFYASDWYGPESTPEDFFLALTTMVVMVSDLSNKDQIIDYQRVEKYGYHLNVTNVPLPSQQDYLTNRGVLNLCAHAYREVSDRLGFGINRVTSFETVLVWTNGTEMV
ncbi:MAG: hypothetical protein L6R38_000260 [Xanthoria sp. 2 TBL-2021]|nr:MAG: hypothetical protein L6R38_000260 [Xanthoria sp. 2 TBL-2021]